MDCGVTGVLHGPPPPLASAVIVREVESVNPLGSTRGNVSDLPATYGVQTLLMS